jgi:acyl-coenzyme A synthetase/AMP-(fatty) acid ligase
MNDKVLLKEIKKWEVCVLNFGQELRTIWKPSKVQRHLFFSFSGNYFTGDGALRDEVGYTNYRSCR